MMIPFRNFCLLLTGFCLCAANASAQSASIDPRTALSSACIAPSDETNGLEFTSDSSYLQLNNVAAYASIDGERMKRLVEEQAEIARRYRAAGNQYWGRIIGTSSDHETADWMMDQLHQSGVENVRLDRIALPTQWMPRSWKLAVEIDGTETELSSAWPAYGSVGTTNAGETLELIDVGLGMATDFQGRDVRGKAVILHSIATSSTVFNSVRRIGALQRAEEQGAAAIFIVLELPGNLQTAFYDVGTSMPTFSIGAQDAALLQNLLVESAATDPVVVHVAMEVENLDGLSTSSVRGEIPAESSDAERIVIVAHRDAYFEGAADNGSGVVTALELMRYFAQIPKAERTRSIEIIGTPGHHNSARTGFSWLSENRESILDDTVLLINAEHTAHALIDRFGDDLCTTNAIGPFSWQIHGSNELAELALKSFDEFGITRWATIGGPVGEIRPLANLVPSIVLMHAGPLLHTNMETTEAIPEASLVATTKAYARIIERVNNMTFSELTQ